MCSCRRVNSPYSQYNVYSPQYDVYQRGEIANQDFLNLLRHTQIRAELDPHTLTLMEVKAADPQRSTLTYQDFVNMVSHFHFIKKNPLISLHTAPQTNMCVYLATKIYIRFCTISRALTAVSIGLNIALPLSIKKHEIL